MNRDWRTRRRLRLRRDLALLMTSPAAAATGDTLRVIGERVNLRAGPRTRPTCARR